MPCSASATLSDRGADLRRKPPFMEQPYAACFTLSLRPRKTDPTSPVSISRNVLVSPPGQARTTSVAFGKTRGCPGRRLHRDDALHRCRPLESDAVREHPYEREVRLCVTEVRPIRTPSHCALRSGRFIPVVQEQCVGCGVCEMICPVEPTAIVGRCAGSWKEKHDGSRRWNLIKVCAAPQAEQVSERVQRSCSSSTRTRIATSELRMGASRSQLTSGAIALERADCGDLLFVFSFWLDIQILEGHSLPRASSAFT